MNETLQAYKESLDLLKKLEGFVIQGEEFGLSLPEDFKKKLAHAIKNITNEKLKIALIGGIM